MTTSTASRAAGLLIALTTTAALAACSSSDGGSDAASGESAPASRSSDSGSGSGAGSEAGGGTDGSASDRAGADGPTTPQMERSVISSGTISLAGEDVRATRREVQRVVDAKGGEVTDETSETDSDGDTAYVRLVVRVPSAEFGETMSALEQVGMLRSSDRGSDDVTTEVIDTGVRVRAQEASLRRVEMLLADARDLKDIIWIESQLTSRQAELDSLKSQQSWLADQTSLSTITVDISRHEVVEDEPEDEPAGFLAGLEGGTEALRALVTVLTTVLGALLPFAAVALLLGLPVWLVVRRRRATAPAQPPAA
ncbi:DUF4349 domain-containing protein [Nocardioides ganghwensis]|jgi:hypothetical protein|uniref:DUF4349 domain-containing protein n=1 Tax=Nocardioides ganghwensis TaxID=252230 RepID=A0A4Q2SE54_9ACTN|nr:DUF4349 domain-containing protein [Nocardioides ganghwensis]MBD3944146.1 DUF4349 domain-containing protein [Nocardioides ganghwensis]RYC01433.1 DUF4349 domain-containing protein [Nocardioides ganghwensis]